MPLEAGTTLRGRYHIEFLHKLGKMGAVYKAYDEASGVHVALKENLIATAECYAQFVREARFLAGLRHPNIPRATDFFHDEAGQFIVMDFIDGENLADWVSHDAFPAGQLIPILQGPFHALSYIHSLNPPVIHRDVEPSNLILTSDQHLMLIDFGLAKVFDATQPPPRTDHRSDQYSLAATIYALLTRRIPVDALERAMGREEYLPPSFYEPLVPKHVDLALGRALSVSADDRYRDIVTFWEALNGQS